MYTLEDDDETSSRIRKQELVGFAETQKQPSNVLKARQTRLLRDNESSTNPGMLANSVSFSADGQDAISRALGAAEPIVEGVPSASPSQEEDQTRPEFPDGKDTTLLLPPPTSTTLQEVPDKKYNREGESSSYRPYEDEAVLSPVILKQHKRKRLIIAAIVLLAIFVGVGALTAGWFRENAAHGGTIFAARTNTKPVVSGPRMVQLALDKSALTSLFAAQIGGKQGVLSDLKAAPSPNDGLMLSFNLHIDANGIQRVIPVEIGGKVGLDGQHHLQLMVQQLKRDGVLADVNTVANMQNAVNQMLASTVTAALQTQFKGTKLISVHTSKNVICAQKIEMIVLQVEIPAFAGVAAQPTPVPFCIKGQIDLKKLLPQ